MILLKNGKEIMSKKPIIQKVGDLITLLISGEPANDRKYPMIIINSDSSKKKVYVKKVVSLILKN